MRLKNIPKAKEAIENSRYVVKEPQKLKGKWRGYFGKNAPLCIEIGMGKGRFLMEMASKNPDICFLGIEMYDSVLFRAVQKMESLEAFGNVPENLRFLCLDARLLPDVFEEDEVDRIYLNFSDPWPKARHEKRRLTSRIFLGRYGKFLKKGGTVEFKTDNRSLFDFSLAEAEESGWEITEYTYDLHNEPVMCSGNVMTEYEEKFSSIGKPICRMVLRR
ncbi:MAG: tRNA (guanosine(46)-N7)-methyltransferase TrmB [Blautia sp.]|nr:tRNA (guanosine(46)-N7)-methyltransferase TrmB [Blautia sp.]